MRVFNSEGSPSPPGNLGPGRSPTRSTLRKSQNFVTNETIDLRSFFIKFLLQPEIDQIVHFYAALRSLLFNLA
jgi:hypothetical protein